MAIVEVKAEMNLKVKKFPLKIMGACLIFIVVPLVLLMPMIISETISYRMDTWFHLMRIMEMRKSLETGSIFGTLGNIFTFGGAGQLVNGMYPSAILRLFVAMTNWLKPVMQVYVIIWLILAIAGVSNFWLFKRIKFNIVQSVAASLVMTYALDVYVTLKAGSIGLGISLAIVPWLFYGLMRIKSEKKEEQREAAIVIGFTVGLFLLSHVMSALLGILMVVVTAVVDLIRGKRNFIWYVISGISAILVGLPTIVTTLMFNKHVLPVSSYGESSDSFFNMFSPLWDPNKGTAYFGWTAFTVFATAYVFLTILKRNKLQSLKFVAIVTVLMGTNIGYFQMMNFMQFPERFWIFGMLLSVFIMIIEVTTRADIGKLASLLMVAVTLVASTNTAVIYNRSLKTQTIWQNTDQSYNREKTKFNDKSYNADNFNKLRTYVDYLPIQQKKNVLPVPNAMNPSKEMLDVNFAHSVRKTGFRNDQIKISKDGRVTPLNKVLRQSAKKTHTNITVKVPSAGNYDLPFWAYSKIQYDVNINKKASLFKISNQGRMSVTLKKGINKISINQKLPIIILISYVISILSIVIMILLLFYRKKDVVNRL